MNEVAAHAIVTSAGKGERLGDPVSKLEVELLSKPLILHTLLAFEQAHRISTVILTVPGDRLGDWTLERLHSSGAGKVRAVVAGGETRQDSVRRALEEVPDDADLIVIHDGARPLVTPFLIDSACSIPDGFDGVVAAIPVTDTVKKVRDASVQFTPERSTLVAVQTPQCFKSEAIKRAHRLAAESGFDATDDSSLVERAGGRVAIIEGSRENFKVTFPDDVLRARIVLEKRKGRQG